MKAMLKVKEFRVVRVHGDGSADMELTADMENFYAMLDEMAPVNLGRYLTLRLRGCHEQKAAANRRKGGVL